VPQAITYLPYLPNINWLQNFVKHQPRIEAHENFVKSTCRNRCEIAGANGKQILPIPLEGGRDHHRLYREVRISYHEDWQKKHWQSIRSAYGSAPFFEFYADRFQPFYERRYELLFDFNMDMLKTVLVALKFNNSLTITEAYQSADIDLRRETEISAIEYHQVFRERNGFYPNLCALDLLFNEGNRSKAIICR
jgi:hypothetical protein